MKHLRLLLALLPAAASAQSRIQWDTLYILGITFQEVDLSMDDWPDDVILSAPGHIQFLGSVVNLTNPVDLTDSSIAAEGNVVTLYHIDTTDDQVVVMDLPSSRVKVVFIGDWRIAAAEADTFMTVLRTELINRVTNGVPAVFQTLTLEERRMLIDAALKDIDEDADTRKYPSWRRLLGRVAAELKTKL